MDSKIQVGYSWRKMEAAAPDRAGWPDMILGVEDILISWFVIILALLGVASLFVCCMIHCKHFCQMLINSVTYLLTYLLTYLCS